MRRLGRCECGRVCEKSLVFVFGVGLGVGWECVGVVSGIGGKVAARWMWAARRLCQGVQCCGVALGFRGSPLPARRGGLLLW